MHHKTADMHEQACTHLHVSKQNIIRDCKQFLFHFLSDAIFALFSTSSCIYPDFLALCDDKFMYYICISLLFSQRRISLLNIYDTTHVPMTFRYFYYRTQDQNFVELNDTVLYNECIPKIKIANDFC